MKENLDGFQKDRMHVSSHLLRSRAHALESFRGHCLRLTRRFRFPKVAIAERDESIPRGVRNRVATFPRSLPAAQPISRESHISLEIVRARGRKKRVAESESSFPLCSNSISIVATRGTMRGVVNNRWRSECRGIKKLGNRADERGRGGRFNFENERSSNSNRETCEERCRDPPLRKIWYTIYIYELKKKKRTRIYFAR